LSGTVLVCHLDECDGTFRGGVSHLVLEYAEKDRKKEGRKEEVKIRRLNDWLGRFFLSFFFLSSSHRRIWCHPDILGRWMEEMFDLRGNLQSGGSI